MFEWIIILYVSAQRRYHTFDYYFFFSFIYIYGQTIKVSADIIIIIIILYKASVENYLCWFVSIAHTYIRHQQDNAGIRVRVVNEWKGRSYNPRVRTCVAGIQGNSFIAEIRFLFFASRFRRYEIVRTSIIGWRTQTKKRTNRICLHRGTTKTRRKLSRLCASDVRGNGSHGLSDESQNRTEYKKY